MYYALREACLEVYCVHSSWLCSLVSICQGAGMAFEVGIVVLSL